ncbi:alpha/beta fold hydrolase [Herbiconiux liangxiaofengii]|uniref:alpha/beta fold hydrolase n=1 Tax=Herbiconiux liangxiaofengii TaxID=3342795 RepID=UPI0035BA9FE4
MSRPTVLFAPGAGGDPARYSAITDAIRDAGFHVIAPRSERFDPRTVTTQQLQARVEDLHRALDEHEDPDSEVTVVGHSVGAWAALCLAGAQPWGMDGKPIEVRANPRVTRLVLLAPTVGWFAAPGALDDVVAPMHVHVGAVDTVTPPRTAEILRAAPAPVDIHEHANVGHFDVMSTLPPTVAPTPGLDHGAFLRELAHTITTQLR